MLMNVDLLLRGRELEIRVESDSNIRDRVLVAELESGIQSVVSCDSSVLASENNSSDLAHGRVKEILFVESELSLELESSFFSAESGELSLSFSQNTLN